MYNNQEHLNKYDKAKQDIFTAIDSVAKAGAEPESFYKSLEAGFDIAKAQNSTGQLTPQQCRQLGAELSLYAIILSTFDLQYIAIQTGYPPQTNDDDSFFDFVENFKNTVKANRMI